MLLVREWLGERYVAKGKYLDDTLYKLNINNETGDVVFDHEYAKKKVKLTPFKIFNKILMKNFWEHIKVNDLIPEIPKHLKSLLLIRLKTNAWEFIKRWVYTRKLEMEYPDDEAYRTEMEKSTILLN